MSDTGVFTKNLCDLYSVSAGAYTTITESELKRATFNVKKDIRELLILMIGKGNFSTPEDEIKHKIKFKILNDNREVELACYYAKRNKEEMSIYFTSEIINRYNIEPDDIWFVCSENDNSIPILGFAKKEKWKANFMNVEKLIEESLGIEGSGELEDDSDDDVGGNEQPFDADKIRIDQQMLSVKYIYELYQSKLLDTNPNFQRKPVWNELRRKSLLIESLMLRIPIPAFYFYENEDSLFQVIDGQQRLLTIFEYINDGFRLSNLEYLNDICGKRKFSELDIKYQQRIYRTQLAINILDARSPRRVIYDIFRRINTGGVNLTLQEMRNAICTQTVSYTHLCCTNSEWFYVTGEVPQIEKLFAKCQIKEKGKISLSQYIKLLRDADSLIASTLQNNVSFDSLNKSIDMSGDLPHGLNATLYKYQKKGFFWMMYMLNESGGCILGDEMGLGKTLQVIAVILEYKHQCKTPVLVIAPVSLLQNWKMCIRDRLSVADLCWGSIIKRFIVTV